MTAYDFAWVYDFGALHALMKKAKQAIKSLALEKSIFTHLATQNSLMEQKCS